jgi:hypothetical protein
MKFGLMTGMAISLWLISPATAQSVLRSDVPVYCQQVADVSGGSSMICNGCMKWSRTPTTP